MRQRSEANECARASAARIYKERRPICNALIPRGEWLWASGGVVIGLANSKAARHLRHVWQAGGRAAGAFSFINSVDFAYKAQLPAMARSNPTRTKAEGGKPQHGGTQNGDMGTSPGRAKQCKRHVAFELCTYAKLPRCSNSSLSPY